MNSIMQKKLSILYEIHNLTSLEYNYTYEDGIEQLGNILAEKQEMIYEIDYLDQKFLMEFDALKKELGVSSLEDVGEQDGEGFSELKSNTSDMLDTLKKIEKLDKKVQMKIMKLRGDISQELTRIKKQRHVSSIYNAENAKGVMRDFGVFDSSGGTSFDKKK
jgi:hypothetical protein